MADKGAIVLWWECRFLNFGPPSMEKNHERIIGMILIGLPFKDEADLTFVANLISSQDNPF